MKRTILSFATLSAFAFCGSGWAQQYNVEAQGNAAASTSRSSEGKGEQGSQSVGAADAGFAMPANNLALWQEGKPPKTAVITTTAAQPVVREFGAGGQQRVGNLILPVAEQPFGHSAGPMPGPAAGSPPLIVQAEPAAPGNPPPAPPGGAGPIQLPPGEPKSGLTPIPEPESLKVGESAGPFQILDKTEELEILEHRSKLLRTSPNVDIIRTAVIDPAICDLQEYTTHEFGFIGKAVGTTQVTVWFRDHTSGKDLQPRTFIVHVQPDQEMGERRLKELEAEIAKLFPNSKVHLKTFGSRIMVLGQARDVAEASEILGLIRGETIDQNGHWVNGPGEADNNSSDNVNRRGKRYAPNLYGNDYYESGRVVNMLKVPGDFQVMLKVRIAELDRTAGRSFGANFAANVAFSGGSLLIQSLLNASNSNTIIGNFDNGRLTFGISYLEQHGVVRLLSEPTLVTLSGKPANFIAGGEFAVPTVVGLGGASAATTDFRAYGAIISFTPYVLDKDLIRLVVNPEFSQIDASTTVGGVPGLTTRTLTTTVELRAGQTLAVGGLLDESMKSDTSADLPWIGKFLGPRDVSRSETELIMLVTPELVHPMEPEEVPPLPGFDVTEPDNVEFFVKGNIEGVPTMDYRSTVWPRLQQRYRAGGTPMIDGPFGHSNIWQNDQGSQGGPSSGPGANLSGGHQVSPCVTH